MGVIGMSEIAKTIEWGTPSPDGDMVIHERQRQVVKVEPPISRLAVEQTLKAQGVAGGALSEEGEPVTVVQVTARGATHYYEGPISGAVIPEEESAQTEARIVAAAEALGAVSDAARPGADLNAALAAVTPVAR